MKKLVIATVATIASLSSADIKLSAQGTVAKAPIEMNVSINDEGEAKGNYFYLKTQKPIELMGVLEGDVLTLKTVNNPSIKETFIGDVTIEQTTWPKATNIAEFSGTWYGVHTQSGELPEGYAFKVVDPFADGVLNCQELDAYPKQLFKDLDLGTGHGSPIKVYSNCPKALNGLDFLDTLLSLANQIRSPAYGSTCSGSIIHAHRRYHEFSLTWLGYSPATYNTYYSELKPADRYFEYWSYQSLYNHRLFKSYTQELEAAESKLAQWYQTTHGVSMQDATVFAKKATNDISKWAYGAFSYQDKAWELVPNTLAALNGDVALLAEALKDANDQNKLNSLRALIIKNAPLALIELVANSMTDKQQLYSTESPVSLAINNPAIIDLLTSSGFDYDHNNEFGKTPLFYAVQYSQHDSVKMLLELGANVNQKYEEDTPNYYSCLAIENMGRTPLMHAAQHADVAMLQLLIENGADVDAKDFNGKSVLDYVDGDEKREYLALLKK